MEVKKSSGLFEEFSADKVKSGIYAAFKKSKQPYDEEIGNDICNSLSLYGGISTKEIRDQVEELLMDYSKKAAKAYIAYGEDDAFLKDREKYMEDYADTTDNAATASETDPNANMSQKSVASLEGEVFKTKNRNLQRKRMKNKLHELYPEVANNYKEDLEEGIIYTHDEASSPALKYYCQAVSLYPLMAGGVGNLDGVTPSAPNDLQSFSGQLTNATFLLSAQCKGAVALGEYQIALIYYIRMEYGKDWVKHIDDVVSAGPCQKEKTVRSEIKKAIKQFIYGVNQPAGNRNSNSPFTNISIYDHTYFDALFKDFYYPDGTQCTWEEVDCVQRIILKLRRDLNLIKPLTFPVTTIAVVNDGKDIIDQDYKKLCAEEWSKGSSHFLYNSNNPSSLASCCRVLNEITENTFSSVNGLQGIMTGSCNVITLNINRITQKYIREQHPGYIGEDGRVHRKFTEEDKQGFRNYLINILERVYKYHIAFKTMLYDLEDKKMFASSNGGYIFMKKLYSTIGHIGYQEAAMFLGFEPTKNEDYIEFLQIFLSTIEEQNKLHSIRDKKRPFLFNSEAIPGENLAVKYYQKDKKDGYYVPADRNLYSSYFFNPWDNKVSVLDKMYLHGECTSAYTSGGQACHLNMLEDLSYEQYMKLIDYSTANKTSYWTINRPISVCPECGHVVNGPAEVCPVCGSHNMDWWVRIIGYLRPLSAYSKERFKEAKKRVFHKKDEEDIV